MNDLHYGHTNPRWARRDFSRYVLDDAGLHAVPGDLVTFAVRSRADELFGRTGTVVEFLPGKEMLASVEVDGDDADLFPRRALRLA